MRCALVALLLGSSGCLFNSCKPPTAPDTCDAPSTAGVTMVELGTAQASDPASAPFTPIADGARLDGVYGGQGSFMVVTRQRLSGMAPGCVGQRTALVNAFGDEVSVEDTPLVTYAETGGAARVTKPIYLPSPFGTEGAHRLRATVGPLTVERKVYVGVDPGPRCEEAWACAAACGFGGCTATCTQGLSSAQKSAFLALTACQQAQCGGGDLGARDLGTAPVDGGTCEESAAREGGSCASQATDCAHAM